MLDDLRRHADNTQFEDETPVFEEAPPVKKPFLGMKPWQRFFIAAILLVLVVLLGALCLLVTEAVVPPFL